MTREEQIRNEAIDFSEYEDNFLEYDDCGDVCDDKSFIENAFISGAKWADETMIEKACEWIAKKHHLYKELSFGSLSTDWHKLIKEFRKAMEE